MADKDLNAVEAEEMFPGSIDVPSQFFVEGVPDTGLYIDDAGMLRFDTSEWLNGAHATWWRARAGDDGKWIWKDAGGEHWFLNPPDVYEIVGFKENNEDGSGLAALKRVSI